MFRQTEEGILLNPAHLLPVVHVVDIIRDGCRGWSDSTGRCHADTYSGNYERGTKGEGSHNQTGDGGHATHSRGGAASDAGDLGLVVEIADVVGDGMEPDDGLPEDLGPLREDFVEEAQAAIDLLRQDGEWSGSHVGTRGMLFNRKYSEYFPILTSHGKFLEIYQKMFNPLQGFTLVPVANKWPKMTKVMNWLSNYVQIKFLLV